ncbi:hypothetical protein E3P99_03634 [Wallemia hederae]|uniref:Uncharacterized protein n=1 Tax=Wallemia hederae TaxID=1540922 RepID=A0A4T0FFA5_9BASI|nr:hypothetical protein E3P99_03634 [Wallemia hederae]
MSPKRVRFGPRDPSINDKENAPSPALPMSPLLLFPEPEEPDKGDAGAEAKDTKEEEKPPPPKGKKGKGVQRKPVPKEKEKEQDNAGGNKGKVSFLNTPTLIAQDFYSEDDATPAPSDKPASPIAFPMANADDEPIIEDLFHEIERDTKLLKAEHDKEKDGGNKKDEGKAGEEPKKDEPPPADTSASEAETSNGNSGPGKKKKKKKGGKGGPGGPGDGKPDEKPADKPEDLPLNIALDVPQDKPPAPLPPTPDAPPAPPKDEVAIAESAPPPEAALPAPPLPMPPIDIKVDGPAEIKIDPPPPPPPETNTAMNPPKAPTTAVSSSFGDMDSTVAPLSTPPTSPPGSRPTTPVAVMPPPSSQYDPQTMFQDGRPSLLTVAFHAIAFNKDSLGMPPHPSNDVLMNSTINMVDRDVEQLPDNERTGYASEVSNLAKQLIAASNELRKAWHESQSA